MVLDSYDLQRELGRGAFGVVHLAARRTDGELFAIKILEFDELGAAERQACLREAQLLSRLQDGCPFVIYNPSVAPLADCMHYCQRHKLAVKLQLLEGFTRAYQVAPNRTHPTMNTYPPTGCVLSGVKVGAT